MFTGSPVVAGEACLGEGPGPWLHALLSLPRNQVHIGSKVRTWPWTSASSLPEMYAWLRLE